MFAAMLFAISIVALSQFAVYYWRAMLAGAAAQPVSERILAAAGVRDGKLTGEDFRALLGLHDLTPELRSGGKNLLLVRVYYALVQGIAMRRLGDPADIANGVQFFVAERSSWVTGQTISIDGGYAFL